jgi:hypothetical protein
LIDTSFSTGDLQASLLPEKSYIYLIHKSRQSQVKIFWNDALAFIYDFLNKSIVENGCLILKLDAERYRQGKFIAITPPDHAEIILLIDDLKRQDDLSRFDLRRCLTKELEISEISP